jgi:tRNA uridine 5-carbamoylmethylation protein Kti12
MILFSKNCFTKESKINFAVIYFVLVLQSCATHHAQYGKNIENEIPQKLHIPFF